MTDEIKFGDNDTLGALVANLVEADCLIILTDQQACSPPTRARIAATLISEARAGIPPSKRWPAASARNSARAA
ncbi:MAG: hypothetical protein V5B36_14730 [Candidatus Accumulibacter sp. UW25]